MRDNWEICVSKISQQCHSGTSAPRRLVELLAAGEAKPYKEVYMAKLIKRRFNVLSTGEYIEIAVDMAEWMSAAELFSFIKDTVPFWKRDAVYHAVGLF